MSNVLNQTKVHLLKNVPFFNNYAHSRLTGSKSEQQLYFESFESKTILNAMYQRDSVNTIKVNFSKDEIENYNYLFFYNFENARHYYCFIVGLTYISPKVTLITYEVDVLQTFMFDFNFNLSYVEREHTPQIVNGLPYVNLQDEGLDYGDEYDIVEEKAYHQLTFNGTNIIFMVLVTATAIDDNAYGGASIDAIPTSLYYYIVPINIGHEICKINGLRITNARDVIKNYATNPDLVGRIVSLYYTTILPINGYVVPDDEDPTVANIISGSIVVKSGPGGTMGVVSPTHMREFNCGLKYSGFPEFSESKLYMYPYSLSEITTKRGQNFTIKNESINSSDLNIGYQGFISSVPKHLFMVKDYNCNGYRIENGMIDVESFDIPVIDDYTASYIQGNKNVLNTSMQYATDNAQRTISQNNANNRLTNASIDFQKDANNIQTGLSLLSTGVGAIATGGASLMGTGMSAGNSLINNMIQNSSLEYSRSQANLNNEQANTNARVSAEQSIGMTQAKLKDINNIPPNVTSQGGNALFSLINGFDSAFYVIKKTIKPEYRNRLEMFFKMFGNKVNENKIPNLKTRQSFNYIKTNQCNIIASIPQNYLNILRSIFDKGITLWHTNDVLDYSQENGVVE